jgi:hypothetical protein
MQSPFNILLIVFILNINKSLQVVQYACAIELNFNYDGSDIGSAQVDLMDTCCSLCNLTQNCFMWTFKVDTKICRLKSSSAISNRTPSSDGCKSSIINILLVLNLLIFKHLDIAGFIIKPTNRIISGSGSFSRNTAPLWFNSIMVKLIFIYYHFLL